MILSVPILGVLKSFLQATDHPYAQVCSFVLEGSLAKAVHAWETARHRLISSASALSPQNHQHGHAANPALSPRMAGTAGHAHADSLAGSFRKPSRTNGEVRVAGERRRPAMRAGRSDCAQRLGQLLECAASRSRGSS
jgi:hypothetical protein